MNASAHSRVLVTLVGTLAGLTATIFGRQTFDEFQVIQGPGGIPGPRVVGPSMPGGPATPQPSGTASVNGVVTATDTNRSVRRAVVRLSSVARGINMTATTDDQGRFQIEKIAAGQYTLTATKPGYLESAYGQRKPGSGRPGTPVSLADGQRLEKLALPLARGGVLAGTVVDDVGEPAFGVEIRLFRYEWIGGERTLRPVGTDRADDRGGYRIGALLPGEYVVMAGGPTAAGVDLSTPIAAGNAGMFAAGRGAGAVFAMSGNAAEAESGYATVFYPNALSGRGATSITLAVSEERAGVDLQLPLVPFGRITGLLTGESGQPVSAEVRLLNADDPLPALNSRITVAQSDGQFSFRNVPPGRYRLEANAGARQTIIVDQSGGQQRVQMQFFRAAPAGGAGMAAAGMRIGGPGGAPEPPLWATAEVVVAGRDSQSVALTLRRGMTVSGHVTFDASAQPPTDLTPVRIVLNTATRGEGLMQSALGQVNEDGTFTIPDVMPGTYRVSVLGPNNWRPKSVDVGGKDALDFMLDVQPDRNITNAAVTMTTRAATLTGTVREISGQPAIAYTIVIFADDPNYWTPQSLRIQGTRPATDGTFTLVNLPAGRYRLAALEDLEDGQWFDPELLKQASGGAIAIALAEGEKKTQDVRVGR